MTDNKSKFAMHYPHFRVEKEEDDWQFYPEAFQSWRMWRVVEYETDSDTVLALQSITYRVIWVPRQELIAECRQQDKGAKPCAHVPSLDHLCGIYSVKRLEDAMMWAGQPAQYETVVYGKVSIWGHCYKFERGYLSEFAYPSLFVVPPNEDTEDAKKRIRMSSEEIAIELSKNYRVEATTT